MNSSSVQAAQECIDLINAENRCPAILRKAFSDYPESNRGPEGSWSGSRARQLQFQHDLLFAISVREREGSADHAVVRMHWLLPSIDVAPNLAPGSWGPYSRWAGDVVTFAVSQAPFVVGFRDMRTLSSTPFTTLSQKKGAMLGTLVT